MSTPFKTCPRCGCNLDPGERCDCAAPAADRAAAENTKITPPKRAYFGPRAVVRVDLAQGSDFTAHHGQ